jgi:RNase adaptor protein for sRNA GlmZ degradation
VAQQITPIRQVVGIGIGCDWGRQRSVVVAAELALRWNTAGIPTEAIHLDIQRPLPADHA